MCGIAGGLAFHADLSEPLERASKRLAARGPDGHGTWTSGPVTLVHRRLAIIDPHERAAQPMVSPDGRYAVSFNGEIYNYRELAERLPGWEFRTQSDTEVLLALLVTRGPRALAEARGMYAFLFWDGDREELIAGRDPYGIKPLYYSRASAGVVFASTCQGLLATGLVGDEVDPRGEASFWLTGSVAEPGTWYRDIKAVPAGYVVRVSATGEVGVEPNQVLEAPFSHDVRNISRDALIEIVRASVTESVRAHEVSDVPISVLLSGGIDSAAVAGSLSHPAGAGAITVSFDEYANQPMDESALARVTAEHFGLAHTIASVGSAEFLSEVEQVLADMDQPSVDGVNTWFAAKAVADAGYKVALSGVGGDELFHGYGHFGTVPTLVRRAAWVRSVPGGGRLIQAAAQMQANRTGQAKWLDLPGQTGDVVSALRLRRGVFGRSDLALLMGVDRVEALAADGNTPDAASPIDARDPSRVISYQESIGYLRNQLLRDADWASMAHGVELRTPLVDYQLLTTLAPYLERLGTRRPKALLAQVPVPHVPLAVQRRPKAGFSIPIQSWLKRSGETVADHPTLDWALAVGRAFGASPHYSRRPRR